MAKNLEADNSIAKTYWASIMDSAEATDKHPATPSTVDATTRSIYNFVHPLLEKTTVQDTSGTEHSALKYAMYLYVEADKLVNNQDNPALSNALASCALMVAAEDACGNGSSWSYGSRLLFDMKKAGIKLSRVLVSAFLAQEGSWENRSKGDLLDGNITAVGIYCARLKVLCHSLAGTSTSCGGSEEALEKIEVNQALETPNEIIGFYLKAFAVPYLESVGAVDALKEVTAFEQYLMQTDFYSAPCSTKYHLCVDGGLVVHTIHVLMQMLWQTLPATRQQLGACVLAAIGHDLCKVGVYRKQYKSKKTYLTDGEEAPAGAYIKEDQGGRFYWKDDFYFEFKDAMPFGHGRKSAYMLLGFFPEIGEEVYSAVDAHMADPVSNPGFMQQFTENPLALNLHIADVLATYLDEHEQ